MSINKIDIAVVFLSFVAWSNDWFHQSVDLPGETEQPPVKNAVSLPASWQLIDVEPKIRSPTNWQVKAKVFSVALRFLQGDTWRKIWHDFLSVCLYTFACGASGAVAMQSFVFQSASWRVTAPGYEYRVGKEISFPDGPRQITFQSRSHAIRDTWGRNVYGAALLYTTVQLSWREGSILAENNKRKQESQIVWWLPRSSPQIIIG